MTVERKWMMTRLDSGDYLLPSNDRQTLWRIRRYWEDVTYVDGRTGRDRKDRGYRWSTWKFMGGTHEEFLALVDEMRGFEDFVEMLQDERTWREWSSGFMTRREAVEDALA